MNYLKSIILICFTGIAVPVVAQNGFAVEKDAVPAEYDKMIFGQFIERVHLQIARRMGAICEGIG